MWNMKDRSNRPIRETVASINGSSDFSALMVRAQTCRLSAISPTIHDTLWRTAKAKRPPKRSFRLEHRVMQGQAMWRLTRS
jgi:hypothetical protein